jgi:hypothetical protein
LTKSAVPYATFAYAAIAGTAGATAAAVGGVQIKRAQSGMQIDEERYEQRHHVHLSEVDRTNEALHALGTTQELARQQVTLRMVDFLRRNAKQVRMNPHLILDGVDSSTLHVLAEAKLDPDVAGWIQAFVNAAVAGSGTAVGIGTAVTKYGKAGTGTAISSLHGAARQKAADALLGGGPLKSGGGGIVLGKLARNASIAGSAVFVAGLAVKVRGTRAKTEANAFGTAVDVAIAQLELRERRLDAVRARAHEMSGILNRLMSQATLAMNLLESEPFNMNMHGERLQAALILVKSVGDVAAAPVADEDGNLDENTERLIFKYRNV